MGVAELVLRGRAEAEARMKGACTIARRDGTTTTDPDTGAVVANEAQVYSGKCRVQVRSLTAQTPNAGEAQVAITRLELHVPISATGLRTGDVATITAVDPVTGDLDLMVRKLRIEVPFHKDDATARRLPCMEGGFA